MIRRRAAALAIIGSILALLISGCGSDPTATPIPPTATPVPVAAEPTPSPDPFLAEWAALKAAAAAEGELIAFFCCAFGRNGKDLMVEAEKELGIKIVMSTGSSRQQWAKVEAERAAGVYSLDVWTGGLRTSNNRLLPAGALSNLKELLIHPEVLDESLWFGGHFWGDNHKESNKVFAYGGGASLAEITYNTDLLDPAEITSYKDLLDPKWKGKIIARDPREAGTSQGTALYYTLMGKDFLRDLLTTQDITFTSDARMAAEQLALGAYTICLFACGTEVEAARKDGLPVQEDFPNALEEGSRISTGGNTLMALDGAPNPNAQKLFVNWFLTKDGQDWWQRITATQSLRNDIPIDVVTPTGRREAGKTYILMERDVNFQATLEEAVNFVKEVMP